MNCVCPKGSRNIPSHFMQWEPDIVTSLIGHLTETQGVIFLQDIMTEILSARLFQAHIKT